MLRDEGVEVVPTWAQEEGTNSYREIDRQLRSIAKKRAGLDVEEARWLREAEKQRIWRKLGFSTALEYLEDVFGYAPRTAMDRLRVAKELGELPELEAELRKGAVPYSAAKELSRVMTRQTEAAWLARARGKNLRDIEELVAGHKKGDDPDAPKDPNLITRKRVLELSPRVDAMLEQCRGLAADQLGSHVEDVDLVELLCRCYLEGQQAVGDKQTRPAHRIVIHKCENCGRGWQEGRGRRVELRANELELAECDAEIVDEGEGEIEMDGAGTEDASRSRATPTHGSRTKVTPTFPRRVRKRVWSRDHGRCRATRNLDVHHIIRRADGGDHDPANLIVLCSGHHKVHHDGLLSIAGRAPDQLEFARDGKQLTDSRSASELTAAQTLRDESNKRSRFDDVVKLEHAKQALMQLGYKARAARKALEEVSFHVGADADIASLVQAVLGQGRNHANNDDDADVFTLAKRALVQLGYRAAIAAPAVETARAHVGSDPDLQTVIKEALGRCTG